MAEMFIIKTGRKKFPEIVKAHKGKEPYFVYYAGEHKRFPFLVGKSFDAKEAKKMAKSFCSDRLHTKKCNIKRI